MGELDEGDFFVDEEVGGAGGEVVVDTTWWWSSKTSRRSPQWENLLTQVLQVHDPGHGHDHDAERGVKRAMPHMRSGKAMSSLPKNTRAKFRNNIFFP